MSEIRFYSPENCFDVFRTDSNSKYTFEKSEVQNLLEEQKELEEDLRKEKAIYDEKMETRRVAHRKSLKEFGGSNTAQVIHIT